MGDRTISISGMEHNPLSLIARAAHYARTVGWREAWEDCNLAYELWKAVPEGGVSLAHAILLLEVIGFTVIGHRAPQLVQDSDGVWRPTALV